MEGVFGGGGVEILRIARRVTRVTNSKLAITAVEIRTVKVECQAVPGRTSGEHRIADSTLHVYSRLGLTGIGFHGRESPHGLHWWLPWEE